MHSYPSASSAGGGGASTPAGVVPEGRQEKRVRRLRMERTLDNWLMKYSPARDVLATQIPDPSVVSYDNLTASQTEEQAQARGQGRVSLWHLSVRGHVATSGGPAFEGRFMLKYDPADGEYGVRKLHFALLDTMPTKMTISLMRPDEPLGLEFVSQGNAIVVENLLPGPMQRAGLPMGCRLLSLDGKAVHDSASVKAALSDVRAKRRVEFSAEWLPGSDHHIHPQQRHFRQQAPTDF
eukprot:Hpha_TRINITY_DN7769_c0_g1::TRINITY_DN7769_c0_g1_i1::g.85518::m.85518